MPDQTDSLRIALPRRIDTADARAAIKRVTQTLHDRPHARFMLAAVAVDATHCAVNAAGCDYTALHWAGLADACLEYAATKLAASGERDIDLLKMVERARAELAFEDRQDD